MVAMSLEETAALNRIADEMRIQNAIMLELVVELKRQTAVQMQMDPDGVRHGDVTFVDDRLLALAEELGEDVPTDMGDYPFGREP